MLTSLYKILLDIIFPQKGLRREINSLSRDRVSEKLRLQEHWEGQYKVISLFEYKDPLIKQMIWLLKYKGDSHVTKLFASALYDYLTEELSDEMVFSKGVKCVIIPLPLSKRRERERGFNQMKLITDELQRLGDFSIDTQTLVRVKHTPPQTTVAKKEDRASNIKGAFEVRSKDNLEDIHVILVDDVCTTGSTLKEAQKTLEKERVYKVSCIALTH